MLLAVSAVCLFTATGASAANPAGPNMAGTWDTTASASNPTYTNWQGVMTINPGVTVTFANGSSIRYHGAGGNNLAGGGLLAVSGTLDLDGQKID